MHRRIIWSLVVLNVALLATLIWRASGENTARAQAAARRAPDVMMIPGNITGGSSAALFLIDVANRELSAMAYDGQNIEFMTPPLDLNRVFSAEAPGAAPANGTRRPAR